MNASFWWGVALGVLGTWVFHAVMPGARAVGQTGWAVRFTGFAGVLLLVVLGVMFADLEKNPNGTTAAGNAIVNIEKPGLNALLGKTS